jgi:ribosomal protein S7
MEQKNQKKYKIMNKISLFEKNRISAAIFPQQSIIQEKLLNDKKNSKLASVNFGLKNSYNLELPCVFSYAAETELIHRFIKFITKKGKKSTAEFILFKTLNLLGKKLNKNLQEPKVYSTIALGKSRKSFVKIESSNISHESISIFTVIHQAIENVKPFFEVKKVRVAGTTVQVPSLVQPNRQESLAINWILQSASERKKKNPSQPFENCLALEIFEAFQKQGQARNKRNELHKLAEVNRAFSHFRWW